MAQKQTLSEEMIKNIKNYGSKEIETIELFVDSVRQNPGEYLSSIGNEGFMNCIREVFQNSADEMERDNSPCNKIWLEYKEIGNVVTVKDNGRALTHLDPTPCKPDGYTPNFFLKFVEVCSLQKTLTIISGGNALPLSFTVTTFPISLYSSHILLQGELSRSISSALF